MITFLLAAQVSFIIQIFHSIEELTTGFHKKWYLFRMPFAIFLLFEICFTAFWFVLIFTNTFSNKETLLLIYVLLMFANGIQHIVWYGYKKKYVPGFFTALLHIVWSTIALFFIY